MSKEMQLPAKEFFPPSLLLSPKITEDGKVKLRPDPEYGLSVLMDKWGWDSEQIDKRLTERREHQDFLPPNLKSWYENEIMRYNDVLTDYKLKAHQIDEFDLSARRTWTRNLILELFPRLENIINNNREDKIFKGKSVEEYVDQIALPNAFGFIDWIIREDKLPTLRKNTLTLFSDISQIKSLFEVVRNYKGKRIDISNYPIPSPETKSGIVFKRQYNHEILSLLYLSYIATLADITKHPKEEETLARFVHDISQAFQNVKIGNLMVNLDEKGQPTKINLMNTDSLPQIFSQRQKKKKVQHDYNVGQPYQVRNIQSSPDGYVLFEEREKELYPRMLRLIRGRFPFPDALGVRFVLLNKELLKTFKEKAISRLRDWSFERQGSKTVPKESSEDWMEVEKYTVRWKRCKDLPIEMQIHWLKDTATTIGSYAKRAFGKEGNHYRYRIDQLINHVYPYVFPQNYYGIDWNSDSVKDELHDYAYQQTLQAALIPPIE